MRYAFLAIAAVFCASAPVIAAEAKVQLHTVAGWQISGNDEVCIVSTRRDGAFLSFVARDIKTFTGSIIHSDFPDKQSPNMPLLYMRVFEAGDLFEWEARGTISDGISGMDWNGPIAGEFFPAMMRGSMLHFGIGYVGVMDVSLSGSARAIKEWFSCLRTLQ